MTCANKDTQPNRATQYCPNYQALTQHSQKTTHWVTWVVSEFIRDVSTWYLPRKSCCELGCTNIHCRLNCGKVEAINLGQYKHCSTCWGVKPHLIFLLSSEAKKSFSLWCKEQQTRVSDNAQKKTNGNNLLTAEIEWRERKRYNFPLDRTKNRVGDNTIVTRVSNVSVRSLSLGNTMTYSLYDIHRNFDRASTAFARLQTGAW